MTAADPPAVLLGGAVNAVSAARSLGSRGIRVRSLAESQALQPVRWSRFISEHVMFPGGNLHTWWRDWLERRSDGSVVLPTSDHGLEFIARNRSFLESLGYRPVEANDDLVLALLDKGQTYRVAMDAGVEAPKAVRIQGVQDLTSHKIGYPCAIKPVEAHRAPPGFRDRKVVVAHDQPALEAAVRAMCGSGASVVVTEVVPGADDAFCSYYTYLVGGDPLFHYTKRKLRQHPIHFGDGSYHVGEDISEAREIGLRLFRAAGLVGLGNVEFKRDARDGRLKLIECNLRLTAADPMIRAGGLDLTQLLYDRACGRQDFQLGPLRQGVRQWDPSRDVRAFVQYRRAGEITTTAWVWSILGRACLPLFSLSDPGPSMANAFAAPQRLFRLNRRRRANAGKL